MGQGKQREKGGKARRGQAKGGRWRAERRLHAVFFGEDLQGHTAQDLMDRAERHAVVRAARLPPPMVVQFRGALRVAWCTLRGWVLGDVRRGDVVPLFTWRHEEGRGLDPRPTMLTAMRLSLAKETWDGSELSSPVLGPHDGHPEAPRYAHEDFSAWACRQIRLRLVLLPLRRRGVEHEQAEIYARLFADGVASLPEICGMVGLADIDVPEEWRASTWWVGRAA